MSRKFTMRNTTALLAVMILVGCHPSQNASTQQVLTGYQPEIRVNPQSTTIERRGPNEFEVALTRPPIVDKQLNPSWCWAASVAALLNYYPPAKKGAPAQQMTQDDVIRDWAVHKSNQSATEADVLLALAPELFPAYAKALEKFNKRAHKEGLLVVNGPPNPNGWFEADLPPLPGATELVNEIANGNPVIVAIDPAQGELGHVVVATRVRFSSASNDVSLGTSAPYFIRDIVAIDPWDKSVKDFSAYGDITTIQAVDSAQPASAATQPSSAGTGQNNGATSADKNAIDRVSFAVSVPMARAYLVAATKAYNNPKWVPANNGIVNNSSSSTGAKFGGQVKVGH